jgi:hypothetical protein
MDQTGYILELYEMQKIFTNPGEAAKQLLSLFAEKICCSTYQCYKELNKQNKISYKNVHKKVKKLHELGLLHEVSNNDPPKHGSIYYKISSFGIYFIFLTPTNPFNLAKLIENYPNNGLFEYFLYQFIEKKTIKEIKSNIILGYIFKFLKECCSSIESLLKNLSNIEKDRGYSTYVTVIANLIDPDMEDYWYGGSKEFIDYLKTKFKIKWLNKNTSKIKFNKSDNLIEIVEKNDNLVLKLDTKIKKAILYDKKNQLFEFDIEAIDDTFAICEFIPKTVKEYVMEANLLGYERYVNGSNLCMEILKSADFEGREGNIENFAMITSLKLLSKDQRFRNTLQEIKNNFENNFYNFESWSLT